MFTRKEIDLLIELVSNEQIHMIRRHPERFATDKYKFLEMLKIKLKEEDVEEYVNETV